MIDLEIPVGKKTAQYRFFEMLPAILSYGALILLIVLSLISPVLTAIYLLLVTITLLVKAAGIAFHTIQGRSRLDHAQRIDWHHRLAQLQDPVASYEVVKNQPTKGFDTTIHHDNLRLLADAPSDYPRPSEVYNAVIVATYNEAYEVLRPTLQAVADTHYDNEHIILVLAYEERAGAKTLETAKRLQKEFEGTFFGFLAVGHPVLPGEVKGKGANITYAGHKLQGWLDEHDIEYKNVIVTTLDSDNRPHPVYFDYLTYEYIVHDERKHLAYQPVTLFLGNIWDAPALMRVIATGNSFWGIISSMRPHSLRNFASHSQSMDALVEMNFWSTHTIVEDGHHYWRSYFYFSGNYSVMPIYAAVYQDAVFADTFFKTLWAQFLQLRRWAYGASDVPYVASHLFTKNRNVPFLSGFGRFVRLLDSHVTLACVSILVTFGGWVPLFINTQAAYRDPITHQLPDVMSAIQQVALVGLFITIFLSLKILPPRPARYKAHRTLFMVAQWALMPITSICYNAAAALNAQGRLFLGKYLETFDVTDKATIETRQSARTDKHHK